ncbi:hypothetical protein [Candidatus Steffania adelgidicola]|nr:hypothetical protein [Candidatus Steffania adelgidicola]
MKLRILEVLSPTYWLTCAKVLPPTEPGNPRQDQEIARDYHH